MYTIIITMNFIVAQFNFNQIINKNKIKNEEKKTLSKNDIKQNLVKNLTKTQKNPISFLDENIYFGFNCRYMEMYSIFSIINTILKHFI